MENIVVVGSSGHAKVVIDTIEKEGKHNIIGLIDEFREINEATLNYKVLGKESDLPKLYLEHNIKGVIIAIGDNHIRSIVVEKVKKFVHNVKFITTIHPNTSIAMDVNIGKGTAIMAGVIINSCCNIGDFCILNTKSSLDHDSDMSSFSSFAQNVTTGGNCTIGQFSAVGIGSNIVHKIEIGEHTVIGAGSTVLNNIDSFCVSYGTPSKILRQRKIGDKYL